MSVHEIGILQEFFKISFKFSILCIDHGIKSEKLL